MVENNPNYFINEFDCHFCSRKENQYKMLEIIPTISLNEFDVVISGVTKKNPATLK